MSIASKKVKKVKKMSFDPLLKTALLRCLVFWFLGSISALLFVAVEYKEKDDKEEKYKLLLSLYESLESKYSMSIDEFNNISRTAHEALSEPKPQWIYLDAILFIFHAWTTIGYGNITPQTPSGQVMCIFISLLGIPITLLMLKSMGELIAKWVNTIITKFEKKFLKTLQPKHMQIKTAMVLFSIMVISILTAGFLSMPLRNWSIVESVYFWFVTFTTIGFGDYVLREPRKFTQLSLNISVNEDSRRSTSKIITILVGLFPALLALCIVSSVINSIMAVMEKRRCHPLCSGCISPKTQDHAEKEQSESTERRENNTVFSSFGTHDFQKKTNFVCFSETEIK